MRLFKVKDTGEFSEFKEHVFKNGYTEETLEAWLEQNSESIVEDGALLIIGRQVTTNLGCFIDLLALDREGNTAIIELKRGKTPRETVAQALEYSSWVETLGILSLNRFLEITRMKIRLVCRNIIKHILSLRTLKVFHSIKTSE